MQVGGCGESRGRRAQPRGKGVMRAPAPLPTRPTLVGRHVRGLASSVQPRAGSAAVQAGIAAQAAQLAVFAESLEADAAAAKGRPDKAVGSLRRVVDICEGAMGPNHAMTQAALWRLNNALHDTADFAHARPVLDRIVEAARSSVAGGSGSAPRGSATRDLLRALLRSAAYHAQLNQAGPARVLAEEALRVSEAAIAAEAAAGPSPPHPHPHLHLLGLHDALVAATNMLGACDLIDATGCGTPAPGAPAGSCEAKAAAAAGGTGAAAHADGHGDADGGPRSPWDAAEAHFRQAVDVCEGAASGDVSALSHARALRGLAAHAFLGDMHALAGALSKGERRRFSLGRFGGRQAAPGLDAARGHLERALELLPASIVDDAAAAAAGAGAGAGAGEDPDLPLARRPLNPGAAGPTAAAEERGELLSALGLVRLCADDVDGALEALVEGMRLQERLPGVGPTHASFAVTLSLMATAYHALQKAVTSEGLYRAALDKFDAIHTGSGTGARGSSWLQPLHRRAYRLTMLHYADLLYDWDDRDVEGVKVARRAREVPVMPRLTAAPEEGEGGGGGASAATAAAATGAAGAATEPLTSLHELRCPPSLLPYMGSWRF